MTPLPRIAVLLLASLPGAQPASPVAGAPPATASAPATAPASAPALPTTPGEWSRLDTGILYVPEAFTHGRRQPDLLVHFHGDPPTVARSVIAARLDCAVIIINYPGLSAAYAGPFRDRELFGRVIEAARTRLVQRGTVPGDTTWRQVCVSSFSAGYGAVREILKDSRCFDRIDGLCSLDSMYAGYVGETGERKVDPADMVDFRRFARAAADGRKTFIVTHSYLVPGSYASTVETADDLIAFVGAARKPVDEVVTGTPIRVISRTTMGHLDVWGCAGTDGQAHMQHLRNMSIWIRRLPLARHASTQPAGDQ